MFMRSSENDFFRSLGPLGFGGSCIAVTSTWGSATNSGLLPRKFANLTFFALVAGTTPDTSLRADFRKGDEDGNFSFFRVRQSNEWLEALH